LPQDKYEYAEWRKAKPGIDYHVEVMHKGHRVAAHPRHGQGRFSTLTEHMPKSHQAHRDWSPGRFMNWASGIGPCTAQV